MDLAVDIDGEGHGVLSFSANAQFGAEDSMPNWAAAAVAATGRIKRLR